MTALPSVSVVVPTYRRLRALRECLRSLAEQEVPADEVVVVCRADDTEVTEFLERGNPAGARAVHVDRPGTAHAVARGACAATSDIVAFTDDDAQPARDWVKRLKQAFGTDASLAGLGGPDRLHPPRGDNSTALVGKLGRWGKLYGNHHRPAGPRREVDVLKGVNMAFRRSALMVPVGLRGSQTQLHYEVAMSLAAAICGSRVVFDPELIVDHRPRPRCNGEDRGRPDPAFIRDTAYNLVGCILAARTGLIWRRAAYGLLVGDRGVPGVARSVLAALRREPTRASGLIASLRGQGAALRDHRRGRGIRLVPLEASGAPARRLRVAIVAHDVHDEGGMERAMAQLVRRSVGEASVDVVSRTLAPELRPLVRWHPVPVPPRPFPLKFVGFFVLAGLALRRLDPDVVHTLGAIVPNRADIASVHFSHASFIESGRLTPPGLPPMRRLNRSVGRVAALLAERWVYRPGRVGVLAAVSEGLAAEVRRLHPGVSVEVTPNGVDVDMFRPSAGDRAELRDEVGVPQDAFVVLFVGGDWNRKGLDIAIDAISRIAGAELWVVGRGDGQRYATRAERAGAVVRFFGPRRDTHRFYAAADVFVLPSLAETFSLAAHEAAASALPIVATAVHGIRELVGDGAAGILVARDPGDVAAALERLLRDTDLRQRLSGEARRRAEAFSWESSCAQVIDLYRRLSPS